MDLAQCIVLWAHTLRSTKTAERYALDIQQFILWAETRGIALEHPEQITRPVCDAWWTELKRRYGRQIEGGEYVLLKQTAQTKFMTLASLMRYCENNGHITHSPTKGFMRGRRVEGSPRAAISLAEARKVLSWAWERVNQGMPFAGESLQATLAKAVGFTVLATTGLRVGELIGLRVEDFEDGPEPTLTVLGKGAKPNRIRIHADTAKALRRYLTRYPGGQGEALLRSKARGRGSLRWTWNRWLRIACEEAGVRKMTCHQFRSTLATELHLTGVPLSDIQRLLGHVNVTTTARYVHLVDERRQAAALRIDVLG